MKILDGFSVEEMQQLVGDAMEPVLRPLVYAEPLQLVQHHRERGERVYIVSATLQEIVEHIADDLGFDGAIGSTCEIVDGVYTGRSLRAAHGEGKARALRELAAADGLDLDGVDGVLGLLQRRAVPRGGRPSRRGQPRPAAEVDRARPRVADDPLQRPCSLRKRARGWRRSGSRRPTSRRSQRTSSTRSARGQRGHGLSRIEWLETWDELPVDGVAVLRHRRAGLRALGRRRRARLPDAGRRRRGSARGAAGARARRRLHAHVPDRLARLLGAASSPTAGSSRC